MNENLNTVLLQFVQENVQTNQKWSATAIQLLNTLGNAIKGETELMRQSIDRMETIISRFEMVTVEDTNLSEDIIRTEKRELMTSAQERYPALFYFRHKFPQDIMAPGYYLLINEEGDQLQYQLFDQQWKSVHSGFLPDHTLDSIQAAIWIAEREGITDYLRYEMISDRLMENVREVVEEEGFNANAVEKVQEELPEEQKIIEEKEGVQHEKGRGR